MCKVTSKTDYFDIYCKDPKVTKLIPDVRKRFEPLFEKLTKNDFSASGTSSLTQFVQDILFNICFLFVSLTYYLSTVVT